jgi:ATP-dependent RNA helicase RhlE
VHRIGRTARAGAEGFAISFCDGEERAYLRDIEKLIRMTIPSTERRGERRPAGEPQPNHAANGTHAGNGTHAANAKPPRGHNRKHQGRPQEGRPQPGRHRAAPRVANPRRDESRRDGANRGWTPVRQGQAPRADRPVADTNDIATIAFMKQQPKRGGHGRGAPAHHRTPR